MHVRRPIAITVAAFITMAAQASAQEGDAARGQRVFQACSSCHSLQPNQNMTGPSLSGLWHRKAGTLQSFDRYSNALQASHIDWNDRTLEEWITDPQRMVPGNEMPFPGIKDAQQRRDLIAFLKKATQPGAYVGRTGGGMGGMMGGGQAPSLKKLDSAERVRSIEHCRDTYTIATADGKTRKFWERNLRLKTDSSNDGPEKNVPALLPAGMMGDRADVIFADPGEISEFIRSRCE